MARLNNVRSATEVTAIKRSQVVALLPADDVRRLAERHLAEHPRYGGMYHLRKALVDQWTLRLAGDVSAVVNRLLATGA